MTQSTESDRLDRIADGMYRFDTRYIRPRHTSCIIVVDDGRAAIFDTGVAANVEELVVAVESLGVDPEAVDHVIASHVHLDHMGGIGQLVKRVPAARVAAHPSGTAHLVDPSKLEKGARAVFGDAFVDREYGPIEPVPAERIVETQDGDTLTVGKRELRIIHTPGHAWHHQSVFDPRTATVLASDAFGLAYPEMVGADGPFAMLTTAPPQLAPDAMHASIDRIVGLRPARVLPSHFAAIEAPEQVAEQLHRLMDAWLEQTLQASSVEDVEKRIGEVCAAELERRGRGDEVDTMRELYDMDLHINAMGLWHWRKRKEEKEKS